MQKILALGIIFLFIGVAVAPSINYTVVKASDDNDLVEVTTQACGIKGYGNTTVKLTREQYQNLEQYLVDFRERLNKTATREEAVPLFKGAVVELNKYGLLPKGMSVEQTQKVVTGQFNGKNYSNLFSKMFHPINLSKYNFFSLVSGNVSGAPILSTILFFISCILLYNPFIASYYFFWLGLILCLTGAILIPVNIYINNVLSIPTAIFKNIYMYNDECTGWVETFGLLGIKRFEGTLNGLFIRELEVGIIGFTGIKIHNGESIYDYFLLGSAFAVGIDDTK